MTEVARRAQDYGPDDLALVKAGCLTVAAKLGGLMDEIVIVGGYVPRLLIDLQRDDSDEPSADVFERHVGTRDLDLAFSVTIMDDERYSEIATQLRQAGFEPDVNSKGNPTGQRWRFAESPELKLDFLIPPLEAGDEGGKPKHLEADFFATIMPGVELAHQHYETVEISGVTLRGATARREVRVCSPEVFLVLKGLAIDKRAKDKDEYDAVYMLRNHPDGVDEIAGRFAELIRDGSNEVQRALEVYRRDFDDVDGVGPIAVSQFVYGERDPDTQADSMAFVRRFVDAVDAVVSSEDVPENEAFAPSDADEGT